MIEIRNGFFETNSSSVHALIIPKDTRISIPKSVNLRFDDYGWEHEQEYDTLSYLYTACVNRGQKEVDKLMAYLKRKGVEDITTSKGTDCWGIDHSGEVPLEELFSNENLLDRFCFGLDSYVQLGNDFEEEEVNEDNYDPDKYDVLMKYN